MTEFSSKARGGGVGRFVLMLIVGVGVAYLIGAGLRGRIDEWAMLAVGVGILIGGRLLARKFLSGSEPPNGT